MRRAARFTSSYQQKIQKFIHKKIPLFIYLEQGCYLAYLSLSYLLFIYSYLKSWRAPEIAASMCNSIIKSPADIRALPRLNYYYHQEL
jgi:hypothetical protein